MSAATKLRILCLHGYKQYDIQFKNRTNALRKSIKNLVDFHYVTAPHKIPFDLHLKQQKEQQTNENKSNTNESKKQDDTDSIKQLDYLPRARAWWRSSDDGSKYNGIEESLEYVSNIIKNDGPFDGILGFSQGGVLAVTLCLMQKYPKYFQETFKLSSDITQQISGFKFIWIISGFLPRCDEIKPLLNDIRSEKKDSRKVIADIPLLLVVGKTDQYISQQRVLDIVACFDGNMVSVVEHDGGHYVPSHKEVKQQYVQFLNSVTI